MPISRSFIDKHGVEQMVWAEDGERQRCEIWSRVMGYIAVRDQYNEGKKSEFRDRKFYSEPVIPELQPSLPGTESP